MGRPAYEPDVTGARPSPRAPQHLRRRSGWLEDRKGAGNVSPQAGDRLWKTGRASREAFPAMEGTSGAADRAPLRGGSREAALSRTGTAQAGPREADRAAARPARWARKGRARLCAPDEGGLSSHLRHEPATGGVRADRVGAKLLFASDRVGRSRARFPSGPKRDPWPVKSWLAAQRKARSHPQLESDIDRRQT
jgi:hypothetical protein